MILSPRSERERSSAQIATALRKQLAGMAGTVVRARPSGGNFQLQRILGGGTDARLALEIRGYDLDDARRLSNDAKLLMEQTPGLADVRLAKDDARPELALRVDRDKAALLGLTVNQVATTVRTNIAGTQAAFYRERGREYPIIVRLRPEDRQRVDNVNDVLVSTPTGRLVQAKSLMRVDNERGPVEIERKNLERVNRVNAELDGTLGDAVDNVNARARPAARPARLHRRVRRRGRGAGQGLLAAPLAAAARGDPGLRGDGVAVPSRCATRSSSCSRSRWPRSAWCWR